MREPATNYGHATVPSGMVQWRNIQAHLGIEVTPELGSDGCNSIGNRWEVKDDASGLSSYRRDALSVMNRKRWVASVTRTVACQVKTESKETTDRFSDQNDGCVLTPKKN
jgi:hypothetical protein